MASSCSGLTHALQSQVSVPQLLSRDPSLRQLALRDLAALTDQQNDKYMPELVAQLRGKDAHRILPSFAKVGPPAIPALLGLLNDSDPGARGFAASAISTIRPVSLENLSKLRSMLKDEDLWVRQRVAESLLSIGVVDATTESIALSAWSVLNFSTQRPPGSIAEWIPLLSDDDGTVVSTTILR